MTETSLMKAAEDDRCRAWRNLLRPGLCVVLCDAGVSCEGAEVIATPDGVIAVLGERRAEIFQTGWLARSHDELLGMGAVRLRAAVKELVDGGE